MAVHYSDESVVLHHGDCLDVMASLPDASVDAVVTDPPYDLTAGKKGGTGEASADLSTPYGRARISAGGGFMGQQWDATGVAFDPATWREAFRVLKPGGHLLAFGGTRTWHRLAVAVEDAGFEVRDSIAWLYGSGFPKSLDVSKAIDKANGRQFEDRYALGRHIRERREALGLTRAAVNAWFGYRDGCEHWERQDPSGARVPTLADWAVIRERLGLSDTYLALVEREEAEREKVGSGKSGCTAGMQLLGPSGIAGGEYDITAPATPAAQQWQGWGTALKPAFEPVVVARKPLVGTVAANVLAHGTGALNIDACRIGDAGGGTRCNNRGESGVCKGHPSANTSLGGGVMRHAAESTAGRWPTNVLLDGSQADALDRQSGTSVSRIGKSRGADAGDGWGMTATGAEYDDQGGASRFFPTFRYEAKAPADERPRIDGGARPTVKPLDLMRWLVRLVTPPGGVVLEPFAGSGTTAEACVIEGFRCIAIEREAAYLPLIEARLTKPIQPSLFGGAA